MKNLLPRNGGQTDIYIISAIFFFLIFAFNLTDQIIKQQSIIERAFFTFPFLILAVLFLIKIKSKVDIIIDFILLVMMTAQAETGDFSGLPFLFLLLYGITKKEFFYLIIGGFILSVAAGSILNSLSTPQIFLMISLYLFMGAKYYFKIHKPTQAIREENKSLKSRLEIIGDAKHLTPKQIILKYPFMDERKIYSLRLMSQGKSRKEISGTNKITDRQQDRLFNEMKTGMGIILDEKIYTLQHLMIAAVKLDIIQVIVRHKDF